MAGLSILSSLNSKKLATFAIFALFLSKNIRKLKCFEQIFLHLQIIAIENKKNSAINHTILCLIYYMKKVKFLLFHKREEHNVADIWSVEDEL